VRILLPDPAATDALGRRLAALVQPGDLIALKGALGAGKTSLARGLLAGLGLAGEAPSPSFAIVQPYDPPEVRLPVLHVDLYRLDSADEIEELGLAEARRTSLLLVEWPEHGGLDRWPGALILSLEMLATGGRALTATRPPAWERRWPT